MSRKLARGMAAGTLAVVAVLGTITPAAAAGAPQSSDDEVVVVDEPDTSNLNNIWTFAPMGIPLFGLIDSLSKVPQKLLPDGGGY